MKNLSQRCRRIPRFVNTKNKIVDCFRRCDVGTFGFDLAKSVSIHPARMEIFPNSSAIYEGPNLTYLDEPARFRQSFQVKICGPLSLFIAFFNGAKAVSP